MSDKVQLIKQEIEKRIESINSCPFKTVELGSEKFDEGELYAYKQILQFIDSIPEESDCEKKDYRERYKRIVQTEQFKRAYCDKSLGKEEPESDDLKEELDNFLKDPVFGKLINRNAGLVLAHHFAEWQKQKDQETIELAEDHAMLAGMMKEREEMMKNAVDATIVNDWQYGKDPDHAVIPAIHQRINGFNVGDKVKVIIIKEK